MKLNRMFQEKLRINYACRNSGKIYRVGNFLKWELNYSAVVRNRSYFKFKNLAKHQLCQIITSQTSPNMQSNGC